MRRAIMLFATLLAGCGGSTPTAPTSPGAPVTPAAATPSTYTIGGTVTATNGGQPLAGVSIAIGSQMTTTDGGGHYLVTFPTTTTGTFQVSVRGAVVPRGTAIGGHGQSRVVDVEAIAAAGFDLPFFQQVARAALAGFGNVPLTRWTVTPNVYLRTMDEAGRPVEPEVLGVVADWARRAVPLWTAQTLTAGTVEFGSAARDDQDGWIIVRFVRDRSSLQCGSSSLATANRGHLLLNDDRCGCGSDKIPAAVVLHEMGHALGFYHVDDRQSVMYPQAPGGCPVPALSAREQVAAQIVYHRPTDNADPDQDPPSTIN